MIVPHKKVGHFFEGIRERQPHLWSRKAVEQFESPASRFNLFQRPDIKDNLDRLSHLIHSYKDQYDRLNNWQRRQEWLKELGQRANLAGPEVFYPMGGFDPHTAFSMIEGARDLFIQGGDDFGGPCDLEYWLNTDFRALCGNGAIKYDRTLEDLHMLRARNNMHGLGPLAISRIINYLNGTPLGWFDFNLDLDGQITFNEVTNTPWPAMGENAVIVFQAQDTGELKRNWFLQQNFEKPRRDFQQFMSRLIFQTLMIKAAPGLELKSAYDHSEVVSILNPARRNSAKVISDRRQDDNINIRPIWKEPNQVIRLNLGYDHAFGYNSVFGYSELPHHYIYVGNAENLIGSEEFFKKISSRT